MSDYLIAGSDNQVSYTCSEAPDTATITVVDGDGNSVKSGGTISTTTVTLDLAPADVPVADLGTYYTATIVWTAGGLTRRDLIGYLDVLADDETRYATKADLERFGYDLAASSYLARASARVKAYTGQDILSGTGTHTVWCPWRLPQRPVTSITSVVDSDAATVEYTQRGDYVIPDTAVSPLLVTYAHGWAEADIPDTIREVVCSVAARMHAQPDGILRGIQSESADGESITWGSDAYRGASELTSAEKRALDSVFAKRVPSSVSML